MTVVYGYEMAPRNDLFASIADRASEMLTNSFFPGAALVNAFPACECAPPVSIAPLQVPHTVQYLPEWCPGAGFKKYARQCRKLTRELRDQPYAFVQKQMVSNLPATCSESILKLVATEVEGIAPHSVVKEMLERQEEEAVIKSVAGTTYAGSSLVYSISLLLCSSCASFSSCSRDRVFIAPLFIHHSISQSI